MEGREDEVTRFRGAQRRLAADARAAAAPVRAAIGRCFGVAGQHPDAIERHAELVAYAQKRLAYLGYDNVHVIHGDGSQGYLAHAPYEAIVVAAGGPAVPDSLKNQLTIGGRLVMPGGLYRRQQRLVRVTRLETAVFDEERKGQVAFVPLIGSEGWQQS